MDVFDSELELEGLSRQEYDGLDQHSRDFVDQRVHLYRMFKDATCVADLLSAVSKEKGPQKVVDILNGGDLQGVEEVKRVVESFKQSGQTDIQSFYLQLKSQEAMSGVGPGSTPPYADRPPESDKPPVEPAAPQEQVPLHAQAPPAPPLQNETPPTRPDIQAPVVQSAVQESAPPLQSQEHVAQVAAAKPGYSESHDLIQGTSAQIESEDPRQVIAEELAKWQGMTVEAILKTEKDVVDGILKVADENPSVTVTQVLKACENMIQDEFHDAQFHLEALQPDHRDELLKRARAT